MTKKERVIELLKMGVSVKEISKQLDVLSSNVYKIKSDWQIREKIKEIINSQNK